ncbi:MAG: FKBP-type peptidyl-prolyl cis-trans isomerase [Lachnospiraceae bacterium]|nr:FKBP-type peptidyl-prolyl cis-trans isomerase [Lachnospiraceae bacterium]
MKIATTYENGNIFQHFGRTEYFKVYEVEDGAVVSSEVIGSNGIGHGALAGLLANHDIQVLICGGLGGGALNALSNAGIEVCAGASGNADEAVAAYLRGELVDTGANCDHHHHGEGEDHECCGGHGHGEGEDHECCGGHGHEEGEEHECCGGNGGGCCGGGRRLTVEGKNAGKNVKVHYRGTFDDGTQFDSSYDRGEPLAFVCGAGMMIKGFDKAVADMEVGQIIDVHLMPEEAYGPSDPEAIITIEIAQLPGSENLNVGERVYLRNMMGQPFPVTVTAKDDVHITLDANHEMAGKELNFRIELLEVTD